MDLDPQQPRIPKTKLEKENTRRLIVVLENACLETYKLSSGSSTRNGEAKYALLNCDEHQGILAKMKRDISDARPDITHQCLLTLLDSPLNKAGLMQVFIHTSQGVLIEVNPQVRIPRTFKRFSGLMVQLLHKLKIIQMNGSEVLLKVIKNPITDHLPINCHKITLSGDAPTTKITDYLPTIPKDKSICVFVGAMAHGQDNFADAIVDEKVSISNYSLSASVACVMSDITYTHLKKEDIEALQLLHKQTLTGVPPDSGFYLTMQLVSDCLCLVGKNDAGEILSFITGRCVEGIVHVLTLSVSEKYRRQGIATTLIKKLLSELSEDEIARVEIHTGGSTDEANVFCTSLGLEERHLPDHLKAENGTSYHVGSTSVNILQSSLNSNRVNIPDITQNNSGTGTPNSRRVIRKPTNLGDSYIDIKEDDMHESESPAVIRMKLFAILTTKSDISHPLCIDCANTALDLLTDEFDDLKRERDAYISFDSVATSIKDQFESQADDDETIRLIERLEKETTEKKSKLDELEKEKLDLEREMRELDAEEEELQGEETAYLRQRSTRLLDDQESIQDQISEQHSLNEAQAELARLERTNVWADVFTISSDSGIGTIAGLRLGRINQNVEWSEINAAWGHLALLLYSVANKLNFEFMNARIIPLGSFSKIEKATLTQNVLKWETLELYHPGSALSMLHTRRFDQAMITFLDMLRQLLDWISARDMTVKWPYKITKERIGDNSIRLPGQFTGDKTADEEWTRALRGLLGTSKVLVQWTTSE
ncbi:autophagy protein 6 [Wallemia mellicola]|nr:hypothetical protein E3Q24_01579 [Wallemia mellicola]TIB84748.1 autophagy protein 6 [Wallemia mellicola]TIB87916.1 autophagy protein 6 [Wallemia mellicola]TIC23166.1 autophagy protein 6 [Wallemia mellicola]TIC35260.1 autophagy protein 6 [Wallemia mellicola]